MRTESTNEVAIEREAEPSAVKQWRALTSFARDLRMQGHTEEAQRALQRALLALERAEPASGTIDPKHYAAALSNYAEALRVGGTLQEAVHLHARAVKILEEEDEKTHLADTLVNQAGALAALGHARSAWHTLCRACSLHREIHGPASVPYARSLQRLAELEQKQGWLRRALHNACCAREAFAQAGDSAQRIRCTAFIAFMLAQLNKQHRFNEEVAFLLDCGNKEPATTRSLLRVTSSTCEQLANSLLNSNYRYQSFTQDAAIKLLGSAEAGWNAMEGSLSANRIRVLLEYASTLCHTQPNKSSALEQCKEDQKRLLRDAFDAANKRFADAQQRLSAVHAGASGEAWKVVPGGYLRELWQLLTEGRESVEQRERAMVESALSLLAPSGVLVARAGRMLSSELEASSKQEALNVAHQALASAKFAKEVLLSTDPTLVTVQRQLPHLVKEYELCLLALRSLDSHMSL